MDRTASHIANQTVCGPLAPGRPAPSRRYWCIPSHSSAGRPQANTRWSTHVATAWIAHDRIRCQCSTAIGRGPRSGSRVGTSLRQGGKRLLQCMAHHSSSGGGCSSCFFAGAGRLPPAERQLAVASTSRRDVVTHRIAVCQIYAQRQTDSHGRVLSPARIPHASTSRLCEPS
jgi:hypothetical protein